MMDLAVSKMAHALGWPDPYAIHSRKGVMRRKWLRHLKEPYRNHFAAGEDDAVLWRHLVRLGYALETTAPCVPYPVFVVTVQGQRYTRERLMDARDDARRPQLAEEVTRAR